MDVKQLEALVSLGGLPPWPWPEIALTREPLQPKAERSRAIAQVKEVLLPASEGSEWVEAYTRYHETRLAFDLGHVLAVTPPDGLVVDVGAAPFYLSAALVQTGGRVQALDLNPDRFRSILKAVGVDAARCDIERDRWPVGDGAANTVVMFEVFEHLRRNLLDALAAARRAVADEGRVLVSTPNLRSLMGLYNFVFRGLSYSCSPDLYDEWAKLETLGHMGHVREYTMWELVPFFGRCGFEVETVTFRGSYGGVLDQVLAENAHLSPFLMFTLRKKTKT